MAKKKNQLLFDNAVYAHERWAEFCGVVMGVTGAYVATNIALKKFKAYVKDLPPPVTKCRQCGHYPRIEEEDQTVRVTCHQCHDNAALSSNHAYGVGSSIAEAVNVWNASPWQHPEDMHQ